jgi:hypothetical protein
MTKRPGKGVAVYVILFEGFEMFEMFEKFEGFEKFGMFEGFKLRYTFLNFVPVNGLFFR